MAYIYNFLRSINCVKNLCVCKRMQRKSMNKSEKRIKRTVKDWRKISPHLKPCGDKEKKRDSSHSSNFKLIVETKGRSSRVRSKKKLNSTHRDMHGVYVKSHSLPLTNSLTTSEMQFGLISKFKFRANFEENF